MKPANPYHNIALRFAVATFVGSTIFLTFGKAMTETDVEVNLQGSQKVLNLGTVAMGYSRAQQMIGSAQERNGHINGLRISVTAHGAANAGMGLGAYAEALEEVGVVASPSITQGRLDVDLEKEVENAAAALAGYADSEQYIGYMSGKNLIHDAVKVQSAAQIVNAAGALSSHSEAIQNIGSIRVDDGAGADTVKVKLSKGGSIVNTAESIAAQSIADQQLGEITASGVGNSVAVTIGGKISNTASSLAANVEADQDIGVIRGDVDFSKANVDIEGTVDNIGGGVAASAHAEMQIGLMDISEGGYGNQIKLTAEKGTIISNAAAGYVGSGTVKQTVGGIHGERISMSSVIIEKMGSIYNFGDGIVGKGDSSQLIGVIDLAEHSGLGDQIRLSVGNVSGSGSGIAGVGKVFQNIGVLKAGGHNNTISVTTGDVSGTTYGILGKGISHETIGAILGESATNTSVTVTTGDITTSAQGSGTEVDISVGVLLGDSSEAQQLTVHTGSITAEAIGADSLAIVKVGVIDGNAKVKTLPPHHITVGDIHNKNESISATTVIEVGHIYSDVKGPVSLAIKTGDLSIDAKALGVPYDPGIQIGNVKSAGKVSVNVSTGDISLSPYCIDWHGFGICLGKALVRIGNVNISNKDKGWDL